MRALHLKILSVASQKLYASMAEQGEPGGYAAEEVVVDRVSRRKYWIFFG